MGLQNHDATTDTTQALQILRDHITALNSRFIFGKVSNPQQEIDTLRFVLDQTEKALPIDVAYVEQAGRTLRAVS